MSIIGVDYGVLNQKGSPSWFSDVYANLPTAGYKGRMFISIDTFAFYRDTGIGWDLIGGPGTGTITGSGTSGQVSYFNGSSTLAGSNNLFWDNTNGRLGIGTATPSVSLEINGSVSATTLIKSGGTSAQILLANGTTTPTSTFQAAITLTTTGTSGAATFSANTLNVPNYGSALSGYVPYTGATGAVNLGAYDLTVNTITVGKGGGAVADNTVLGYQAGVSNLTGVRNVFIGYNAANVSTGGYNTIIGSFAGYKQTSSQQNTFVGSGSGQLTTIGSNNTAIGESSMLGNTTGSKNVAIGGNAGYFISDGSTSNTVTNNSIFIGYNTKALADNQTNQTVIGYLATGLGSNTTVINNSSTTNTSINGRVNIFGATDNSLFSLNSGGTLYTVGFSPTFLTISSTTYTITTGATTFLYNGTGAASWTLPNPSGTNQMFYIKNVGTGSITLNAYSGTNIINNAGVGVSSITIAFGVTVLIQQDGNVKSYQLF